MNHVIETTGRKSRRGAGRMVGDLRAEAGKFLVSPERRGQIHHHQDAHRFARAPWSYAHPRRDLANEDRAREVRSRIGVVPGNLALFDNLTGANISRHRPDVSVAAGNGAHTL